MIALPKVKDLDKVSKDWKPKPPCLTDQVIQWIDNDLTPEVIYEHRNAKRSDKLLSAAVDFPDDVHPDQYHRFVEIANNHIRPLGYNAEFSHDGMGIKSLVYVMWEVD